MYKIQIISKTPVVISDEILDLLRNGKNIVGNYYYWHTFQSDWKPFVENGFFVFIEDLKYYLIPIDQVVSVNIYEQ